MITNDFMSSEESGSNNENIVHHLVPYVNTTFEKIDAYIEQGRKAHKLVAK